MNPIQFTDAAVLHLKRMLAKQPNSKGFRLSIKKTGCSGYSYVPDIIETINTNDIHFEAQDHLPVYIDTTALPYLQNVIVDYVMENSKGLKQERLIFVNPNEKGRCGCGESFTVDK